MPRLRRLYGVENPSRFVKDAFHEYIVHGQAEAVNPAKEGTKAAAHYRMVFAIPGLSLGGGRHPRDLGQPPAPLLRARRVEKDPIQKERILA